MANGNKVGSHLTHNTLAFYPINTRSQEQSRGRDGGSKAHRLGWKMEKQQLVAEMRPAECDVSVRRGQFQKREKVEKTS